ncbi:hypothetical protein O2K51_02565 [Apibacter raozihei]|uniref:hypothetical protein n=1 Tax=Apibacter raozihei TaxID=2500547 RepID=UPI000FE36637|nr:hypothetical protein [Apibacter raozihei]
MKNLIVKFHQDLSLHKMKASYLDESVKLTESEEKLLEQLRYIFSHQLKNNFTKQQAIEKFNCIKFFSGTFRFKEILTLLFLCVIFKYIIGKPLLSGLLLKLNLL